MTGLPPPFDGPVNLVEVAVEKIRSILDEGQWLSHLQAMATMARPFHQLIALRAAQGIDPHMTIPACLIKCAQELSLLMSALPPAERDKYAFGMLVYAISHVMTREELSK